MSSPPLTRTDVQARFAAAQSEIFQLGVQRELLEGTLGHRVEMVTVESLSPYLRPYILAEAQDVLQAA